MHEARRRQTRLPVVFVLPLLLVGQGCIVFNSIADFRTGLRFESPVVRRGAGKICAVLDNRLARYQYHDDELFMDRLDRPFRSTFGDAYVGVAQTLALVREAGLEKDLQESHFEDTLIMESQRERMEKIRKGIGARYLVVASADEGYLKFRYDYGWLGGGYIIGTEGGYGRSLLLSVSVIDLEKRQLLASEFAAEIVRTGTAPGYTGDMKSLARHMRNYLEDVAQ